MANVGNVFYPTFTNVFYLLHVFNVFYFHLNVYYIYGRKHLSVIGYRCHLTDVTANTLLMLSSFTADPAVDWPAMSLDIHELAG